jgi:hypothetical protein
MVKSRWILESRGSFNPKSRSFWIINGGNEFIDILDSSAYHTLRCTFTFMLS